jgi:hypothetical protein
VLAFVVEHVLLLAIEILDREAVDRQIRVSAIQVCTCGSGTLRSSGLNHALA